MPPAPPPLGRARELGVVHALVDGARRSGGALLVRGEPGIGKSTMEAAAVERARDRDMRVMRTAGVQSEAHLPYAGLHQLLHPLRAGVDRLADRPRAALDTALGRGGGEPPDPYLVALATLDLLGEEAAQAPTLVTVEDAQWLDGPTAQALAVVARRLAGEPIALLVTARSGWETAFDHGGLPVLALAPLGATDAAALLAARAPDLAPDRRRLILRLAGGNPLALVELPASTGGAGDLPGPPWSLPLTARLEAAFAARAGTLDPASQDLLLVAAVDDGDDVDECLAATADLADHVVTADHLAPAVAAELVHVEAGRLRFRHPLVRSALVQVAGAARRRNAHAALAGVLAEAPDRQLWHRAAAVAGPDESLAAELDAAARRAQRFRAADVAVDAYRHAARLSGSVAARGARLLNAAECALDMGSREAAEDLLGAAARLDLGPLGRARLSWLDQLLRESPWAGTDKVRAAVDLIDRMRLVGDVELALRSLLTVALATWSTAPEAAVRDLVIAAADRLPVPRHDPRLLAIAALAAPVDRARLVLDGLAASPPDSVRDAEALHLLGLAASVVGDIDGAAAMLTPSVAGLRALGRLQPLAQALVSSAWCEVVRGDWTAALQAAGEAERLGEAVGRPSLAAMARAAIAVPTAWRGDVDGALAAAAGAEAFALPVGARQVLAFALLGRGSAALATGRYGDAFGDLQRLFDPADPGHHPFVGHVAVVDVAEAGVGSANQAAAGDLLAPLERLAIHTPSLLLHHGLRVARAMLADDDAAERLFQAALDEPPPWPFMRGRLLLARGAWLRRRRRAADARAPLRTARDLFDGLGAPAWSDRARQELRAAGEARDSGAPAAPDDLTAQELEVALLASQGLTNREIGERLHLSHRTVGAHLYRAFPKLGVSSRSQLAQALRGRPGP